ncbi:NYN domain-containing protein [Candidatus Shapirobacteria bacterium]|nr:NYN domain-containing protein [Candidatus Shapirobacteria bacterium]
MKTYLFIDGTNLYASQYELFGPRRYLNFSKFIKEVEKKIKVKFNKIYFYASYSPKPKRLSKKQKLYLKNEGLFYRSVRETENVVFFKGYRSKTSGKEKEVDVKLAVDIVDFAHRNKYQSLYLFSGDADFLQALFAVEPLKKKICLLCMENKLIYQGLFHFKTYVISFKNKLIIEKRFKSLNKVFIDKGAVMVKVK